MAALALFQEVGRRQRPVTFREGGARNNPGGLRVPGSTQFQRFPTLQAGIEAQESLLRRRYLASGNTVAGVIERYAPRASRGGDNSEASVNNYIRYVSSRLGISPSTRIDQRHTSALAAAMREFETGRLPDGRRRGP